MNDLSWFNPRFEPYCKLVGLIAGLSALNEFVIDETIWELANVEVSVGACLTAQMIGAGPRCKALMALVHYRDPNCSLLGELKRHGKQMMRLSAKRNRFVHDAVFVGTESGELLKNEITAHQRLVFEQALVKIEDLEILAKELRELGVKFIDLKHRLFDELPPWPKDQYETSPAGFRLKTTKWAD